jgi:endonuclease/exonuclease/phosphatase family metal-dependent hydrolase
LATACAVTGLVVLAGYLFAPKNSQAQMSAFDLRPSEPSLAAPQSTQPAASLDTAPPVTFTHKPRPKRPPKPVVHPAPTLDFTISSFNVLGSSHTRSGGTHARFGPGPQRARGAASLVMSHGVDVVGFQEMQGDQLASFQRATGGRYSFYPGFSLRRIDTENSLAWRNDEWEAVETHTIEIPYFRGHPRQMPYVLLRNRATGLKAWFANFHNPASTPRWGNNQRWRTRATGMEILLANRLEAQSHLPVFITGDMNERAEYYCALTGGTDLEAAIGGSNDGACRPPAIHHVDWIFGSSDVSFSNYREDSSPLVRRTSDHVMVLSDARIVGEARTVTPSPTR